MEQKISTMTELTDVSSGDYIEVSEDNGAGGYNTKKFAVGTMINQDSDNVNITGGTIAGATIARIYTTSADPAVNAAVSTAIVNANDGVIITLTAAGNAQTIQDPTATAIQKEFIVANDETSTDSITVNSVVIGVGEAQKYFWDGTAWLTLEAISASQISFTPAGNIVATNVQAALAEVDTKKIAHALATAEDDFLVGAPNPFGTFVKKTLAQTKTILSWVLSSTSEVIGFTISGGTTSRTLTVDETKSVSDKVDKVTGSSLITDEIIKIIKSTKLPTN